MERYLNMLGGGRSCSSAVHEKGRLWELTVHATAVAMNTELTHCIQCQPFSYAMYLFESSTCLNGRPPPLPTYLKANKTCTMDVYPTSCIALHVVSQTP